MNDAPTLDEIQDMIDVHLRNSLIVNRFDAANLVRIVKRRNSQRAITTEETT